MTYQIGEGQAPQHAPLAGAGSLKHLVCPPVKRQVNEQPGESCEKSEL